MKTNFSCKIISLLLVFTTLFAALPMRAFAEEIKTEETAQSEIYLKDVKLVQAKTKEEARAKLSLSGYAFLDQNLNEGTAGDGIWIGYLSTTDPTEAIYDLKLMNMKGGFTRSSMEQALASQEAAIADMVQDLELLVNEFIKAYHDGAAPVRKQLCGNERGVLLGSALSLQPAEAGPAGLQAGRLRRPGLLWH
jgi:hypothetical protein